MTWEAIKLGEVLSVKHGYAFDGEHFTDNGKYVVLTPGNFHEKGGFRRRESKDRYYAIAPPDDYILKKGDLIVAMTEQGEGLLGSSALIPTDDLFLHNQRLGLVEVTAPEKAEARFLYHLFNTRNVRAQIRGSASGTKVRHTAPKRIHAVTALLPPIKQQREIADVIEHYDSFIENNRRRIQLLEESARLFYREWFVRLRFPGHEHVRVVDGAPVGWETHNIASLAETIGGGTPDTKIGAYWDGGTIPWFTPTDLTANQSLALLGSKRHITDQGLARSSAKLLPAQSILMSSRASIGYFGIFDKPCATNQGFITVVPHADLHRQFLLHNLLSRRDELHNLAKGTTFLEISKSAFRSISVLLPTENILEAFDEQAKQIFNMVLSLSKANQKLIEARDLLLPKLMSGEVQA